jgi:hypothetical protein
VVDDVENGVTRFRVGDEVYGDNLALKGGFAEYAVIPESALALEPSGLSFAEASTIPQAGAIALQGPRAALPRVLVRPPGGAAPGVEAGRAADPLGEPSGDPPSVNTTTNGLKQVLPGQNHWGEVGLCLPTPMLGNRRLSRGTGLDSV